MGLSSKIEFEFISGTKNLLFSLLDAVWNFESRPFMVHMQTAVIRAPLK